MAQKKQKAVVIIPTYNERENIGRMIEVLEGKVFPKLANWKMEILVVDDYSPDGTAEVVREKMKKYKNLHLLLGKKQGLGAAYARGMKYAIEKLGADWVVELDADFQHDPHDVARLLQKAREGFDYVVGSRYVPGGKVPDHWGLKRKLLSRLGSFVAQIVLFAPRFWQAPRDLTSGLKATKVQGFLEKINLDNLLSKGYAYKIEIFYRMVKMGAKVAEIPIQFGTRVKGSSKMPPATILDSLRVVLLLRWRDPETQRFLKFAVVGFVGYLVNALGLEALYRLGAPPGWAAAGGAEMAIISNFTWNNLWTFAERKIAGFGSLMRKFLVFNLTSFGAIIVQFFVVGLGTQLTGEEWRQVWLVIAIGFFIIPYNWVMYNKVIWQKLVHKKS